MASVAKVAAATAVATAAVARAVVKEAGKAVAVRAVAVLVEGSMEKVVVVETAPVTVAAAAPCPTMRREERSAPPSSAAFEPRKPWLEFCERRYSTFKKVNKRHTRYHTFSMTLRSVRATRWNGDAKNNVSSSVFDRAVRGREADKGADRSASVLRRQHQGTNQGGSGFCDCSQHTARVFIAGAASRHGAD